MANNPLALANRYSFVNFAIDTANPSAEPLLLDFPVDPTSAIIQAGDPVKQIAGGNIVRCSITDTALLGFAQTGNYNPLPTTIAAFPFFKNATGNTIIKVAVATPGTIYEGSVLGTTVQSQLLQEHDLAYAAAGPVPVITQGGAAGVTTNTYKVTALTVNGESLPCTATATTTSNATLSATNFNILTLTDTNVLIQSYNIYRNVAGTYEFIGTVARSSTGTTVFNDTGQAANTNIVPPTTDYTGWTVNQGATSTQVVQIVAFDNRDALGTINGRVRFIVPPAKSQYGGVAGS